MNARMNESEARARTAPAAYILALAALALVASLAPAAAWADDAVAMYRLYNPNSGEHFYTASVDERDGLINRGWHYEGQGWTAPTASNTPVYRLYNKHGGEHHYTTSASERDSLKRAGWNDEGIGWYSDDARSVPLYRQYNPNQFSCNHNYTTNSDENDWLVGLGWKAEGVGWYGSSEAAEAVPFENPTSAVVAHSSPETYGAFTGVLTKSEGFSGQPLIEAYYYIEFDEPVVFTIDNTPLIRRDNARTFGLDYMQVAWTWNPDFENSASAAASPEELQKRARLESLLGKRVIAFGRLMQAASYLTYDTDVTLSGSDIYVYP